MIPGSPGDVPLPVRANRQGTPLHGHVLLLSCCFSRNMPMASWPVPAAGTVPGRGRSVSCRGCSVCSACRPCWLSCFVPRIRPWPGPDLCTDPALTLRGRVQGGSGSRGRPDGSGERARLEDQAGGSGWRIRREDQEDGASGRLFLVRIPCPGYSSSGLLSSPAGSSRLRSSASSPNCLAQRMTSMGSATRTVKIRALASSFSSWLGCHCRSRM